MNDRGLPARLRVVGELGRGGMVVVLAAVDEGLGRPVAVKVLSPEATGPEERERLLRESRALAQLVSPHTVRVYEAGALPDGGVYVVMERLAGETLESRIERAGPLPLAEALAVVRELLDALAEAHAAGLVHRDVKPSNVMLVPHTSGAGVKLLDFGLVQILSAERLTATGDALGSPAYMAPEQIRAERGDLRTDFWAVGVTLHEMLTGELPFSKAGAALLVSVLSEEPRPLPATFPPEVRALVARCLAKDPAARFADARALSAAVDALAPAPPERAPRTSPRVAERSRERPSRAGFFFLGVTLAVAGGGVAVSVVLVSRPASVPVAPPSSSSPPSTPIVAAPPAQLEAPLEAGVELDASSSQTPPGPAVRGVRLRRVAARTPGACLCIARINRGSGTPVGRAVCAIAETPKCTCRNWDRYEDLCQVPTDAGVCPDDATLLPPAPRRTPCRGLSRSGAAMEGQVECSFCSGRPVYLGPQAGTSCRGVHVDGEWFTGTWSCDR